MHETMVAFYDPVTHMYRSHPSARINMPAEDVIATNDNITRPITNWGEQKPMRGATWSGWSGTLPTITNGGEQKPMRGLYLVWIVNPKTDEIVASKQVVANDETRAKMKAIRLTTLDGDLDDYDIMVTCVGSVRPKPQDDEKAVRK